MIEHGVGEGGLGESADLARDAEGDLVKGLDGLVVEEGLGGPCKLEVVGDVGPGLLEVEGGACGIAWRCAG